MIIIHEYYEDEEDIENGEPEKVVEEIIPNLPEGSEHTAQPKEEEGYDFHSVDPDLTVEVKEGEDNIIVIKYIREKAKYEVIHIYYRNGHEVGRTAQILEGLHGDQIDSESVERITEYEGRIYKFDSASGDIVLDSDEMKTIVLEYNRSTGSSKPDPKPDPKSDPEPDPEPIEIPEEPTPLAPEPVEIPTEEVPLASVPTTGVESMKLILMSLTSALGLAGLTFTGKKREEEME